jgi:hypothetical protein
MSNLPLNRFLNAADPLARLRDHAARLAGLQAILATQLPDNLVPLCRVANCKGEQLIVHAANGAVAARLRQMLPGILDGYAQRGVLLSGIRIKVQLVEEAPPARYVAPRTVSATARQQMQALAGSLPADSPLGAALQRFVRRSG